VDYPCQCVDLVILMTYISVYIDYLSSEISSCVYVFQLIQVALPVSGLDIPWSTYMVSREISTFVVLYDILTWATTAQLSWCRFVASIH
jgi:hypothetical protein